MLPGLVDFGLLIIISLLLYQDLTQSGIIRSVDQSPPPITFRSSDGNSGIFFVYKKDLK